MEERTLANECVNSIMSVIVDCVRQPKIPLNNSQMTGPPFSMDMELSRAMHDPARKGIAAFVGHAFLDGLGCYISRTRNTSTSLKGMPGTYGASVKQFEAGSRTTVTLEHGIVEARWLLRHLQLLYSNHASAAPRLQAQYPK